MQTMPRACRPTTTKPTTTWCGAESMSSSDTADDWGQDADADRRAAYSPKSHPPESNRRPTDYESVALPTELGWRRLKASLGSRSPLGGQVAASIQPGGPVDLKILPSGADDLIQPLDEPIELLGTDAAELPAQPPRRQRPHLADLHPRPLPRLQ